MSNHSAPSHASEPDPHTEDKAALRRRRWWRVLLLSAVIQIMLVATAWYAVQTRRHSDVDKSQSIKVEPSRPINTAQPASAAAAEPNNTDKTASAHVAPQHNPITEHATRDTRHPTDDTGAHAARPQGSRSTAIPATPPASQKEPTPLTPSQPNTPDVATHTPPAVNADASNSHLLQVPIALQTISYRAQLIDGANSIELPPARLSSTHLGSQRYTVTLSNGTQQAGAGNFAWYNTFLMTEHGPNPLDIGGGLYVKNTAQPLRAALGLNLHEDGQTWHWGKKANSGSRTHAYFLDRASLIIYIQGALQRTPIKSTQQWLLPIAGDHAVREVAVQLSHAAAPNVIDHCQPCVQAQVRANLGEMSYWSVWYDGARNWRPVMMKMGLGNRGAPILSLIAQ